MGHLEPTDDENELTDTRAQAAGYARRRGPDDVAARIEAGELNDAPEMRLARFRRQDGEHHPDFIKARGELAAAECTKESKDGR